MAEFPHIFIQAPTREAFETALTDGRVSQHLIAFIEDTHEIWARGKYYPCPYTKAEIDLMIKNLDDSKVDLDTYNAAIEKLENSLKELPVADEEDITVTADNKLQLKDRDTYKILRLPENGILTQDMINEPNTIYEIRYDFDLNDATIIFPENCTLKFEGGKLSNGVISFNNTNIKGTINIDCVVEGTLANEIICIDWFGPISNSVGLIESNVNNKKYIFSKNLYTITTRNIYSVRGSIHIVNGNNLSFIGKESILTEEVQEKPEYFHGGIFVLENCKDISFEGFTHSSDFDVITDSDQRFFFIRCLGNNRGINLHSIRTINSSGAIYSGEYTYSEDFKTFGCLSDSYIDVYSEKSKYPAAIYWGNNLDIQIKFDRVHRGLYLGATNNAKIRIEGNTCNTRTMCLLTDGYVLNEGIPSILGCLNIQVCAVLTEELPEETGTQILVLIQRYDNEQYTRDYPEIISDITVNGIVLNFVSPKLYTVLNILSNQSGYDLGDTIQNLKISCISYGKSQVFPIRLGLLDVKLQNLIIENCVGEKLYYSIPSNQNVSVWLRNCYAKKLTMPVKEVRLTNCTIETLERNGKNDTCRYILDNSVVDTFNYEGPNTCSIDLIGYGNTANRNLLSTPAVGLRFYDTELKLFLTWDGNTWIRPSNTNWKIIR